MGPLGGSDGSARESFWQPDTPGILLGSEKRIGSISGFPPLSGEKRLESIFCMRQSSGFPWRVSWCGCVFHEPPDPGHTWGQDPTSGMSLSTAEGGPAGRSPASPLARLAGLRLPIWKYPQSLVMPCLKTGYQSLSKNVASRGLQGFLLWGPLFDESLQVHQ